MHCYLRKKEGCIMSHVLHDTEAIFRLLNFDISLRSGFVLSYINQIIDCL